ncbi:MAG: arginine decarboxylase [Bacteroidetes bacterium]|nr:arginine decarboxylase [Bacteroidota bacterium]MBP7399840.1 arginine decarboxylase [Chitinophagales bacterium]MBK7110484.1 arginine decarboxylase [Bacteroidota bacterium]MBK8488290.1 arginine decarboxylase [Bacteroidota bacterium]MBK8681948.1 arginine decarboxylase [Bacteroidota bacterium]
MKNTYLDLIQQTFYFPQDGFEVKDNYLHFNGIPLKELIERFGTPLRLTYLPKISQQIQKAKRLFSSSIEKHDYKGKYYYCYCTKSSHFAHVLDEALKNDIHLETSSAFDIDIVEKLYLNKRITKNTFIICNGFKTREYTQRICKLANLDFKIIPVLDNIYELQEYEDMIINECELGIRIAAEEQPEFQLYTSRLGIRYSQIKDFYLDKIKPNPKFKLRMLHFFINSGIQDKIYYWNELGKSLKVYCELKKVCPELTALNIGGGFPVRNSLGFDYDFQYMIDEIINKVKLTCEQEGVSVPDIFTEFGSFTVAESGALIFQVLAEKQQNDSERWYMIDNSLMTTMPDAWGINQRFILLPINKWGNEVQRANVGGLSCDQMDYYNSEIHANEVYLPVMDKNEPLYIGFFHTGAYQESISGYGGIKHCLIPSPQHILIDKNADGSLRYSMFADQQKVESMMHILGYDGMQ